MTRETVDRALAAMPLAEDGTALALDGENCAGLLDGAGWPVLLVYMPDPAPAVVLYAELAEADHPETAFRAALEATHLWQEGPEFTLGLRPGTDELTLAMMIAADESLVERLAPALARFGEVAARWRALLDASGPDVEMAGTAGDALAAMRV